MIRWKRQKAISGNSLIGRGAKLHEQGFTLFELVISLAILSIITLIIGNSYRLAIDAWYRGEDETGQTQRLRVLSGLLSQQLKSSYPYKVEVDDEGVVLFEGESDSVLFVTAIAGTLPGGMRWVRYSYKDDTLFYKEGILPDKEVMDKVTGDEEVVDINLGEVTFSYLAANDDEWLEKWKLGEVLPLAVKVKVSHFQPFQISIPMSIQKDESGDEYDN